MHVPQRCRELPTVFSHPRTRPRQLLTVAIESQVVCVRSTSNSMPRVRADMTGHARRANSRKHSFSALGRAMLADDDGHTGPSRHKLPRAFLLLAADCRIVSLGVVIWTVLTFAQVPIIPAESEIILRPDPLLTHQPTSEMLPHGQLMERYELNAPKAASTSLGILNTPGWILVRSVLSCSAGWTQTQC